MKFGAEYQEALKKEEYPSQWLNSAISYKRLKKCIRRVREELLSLGLDHETLEALWQHVGADATSKSSDLHTERMLQYQFTSEQGAKFIPKLTIALDPRDGSPMDAWLTPETRRILQKVGRRKERRMIRRTSSFNGNGDHRPSAIGTTDNESVDSRGSSSERDTSTMSNGHARAPNGGELKRSTLPHDVSDDLRRSVLNAGLPREGPDNVVEQEVETIEVPLTSDNEFFQILTKELQALENLQDREKKDISADIEQLSHDLSALRASKSKRSKAEMNAWREIFRLYIESEIFMSNHESDAGVRPADKAATYFKQFSKQITNINTNPPKPKSHEAHIALDRFLNINTTLLRLLKFQELNRRALGKIMKKFDKQTSLHAAGISGSTPDSVIKTLTTHPNRPGLNPRDLARSTAFAISQSLLSIIPQLDDYLCPVCAMITYKPVRLRCNHVFCIRCMIRLQRDAKNECPLCREKVVLEATEDNLDLQLKKFLKKEFKSEVDEKRRENEIQAGKELFGESYEGTQKCAVM
ncbi:hypothetical protein LTR70_001954 [Exophiala xenobiotica]|nr:hypothetical protein LTR70_001954 [Exophiala xenobiotica]